MAAKEEERAGSLWFRLDRYDQLLKLVNASDLVEFDHGSYRRRAVYIGWYEPLKKCSVAQATLPQDRQPDMGMRSIIKYQPLEDLLGLTPDTRARVNNHLDHELYRFDDHEVVRRALNAETLGYPVTEIGNEHFAQWCRYREKLSVKTVMTTVYSVSKFILWGVVSLVKNIPSHFMRKRTEPELTENKPLLPA